MFQHANLRTPIDPQRAAINAADQAERLSNNIRGAEEQLRRETEALAHGIGDEAKAQKLAAQLVAYRERLRIAESISAELSQRAGMTLPG